MNRIITILSLIGIFALCSCSNDDNDTTTAKGSRTVLMYICAANNLDTGGYYLNDYKEIAEGAKSLKDGQCLLAFIDRYKTSKGPQIVRFTNDTAIVVKQYDTNFYCTDPTEMGNVMKWVVDNYPSESYGLTFWGHGSGWLFEDDTISVSSSKPLKAYGYDAGTSSKSLTSKWINFTTLAQTIKSAMPKLDFIFFDCCNMQCAEVAYELRNCADYIIGAPSEIPGYGAPYDYVVKDFFLNKDNVGKAIVDDYSSYGYFYQTDGVPLSVIKTEAMDNLAQATQYALTKFMPKYPEEADVDSCIYYYQINATWGLECMYDIRNFMRKNLSKEDFSTWDEALTEAVPYREYPAKKGNYAYWTSIFIINFQSFDLNDDTYGGMSMYIPLSRYAQTQNEGILNTNTSIKQTGWGKIVDWSQYGW